MKHRLIPALAVALALAGTTACATTQPPAAPRAPSGYAPAAPPASSSAVPAEADLAPKDALTTGDLLPTSPPTRVEIPALRVTAPITGLGLQPDGTMQVPTDARTVGWFTEAPTPGSLGPAVLAGHVDYHGAAGTFARLADLRRGDKIHVARADDLTAVFTVSHVDQHPKDAFPTEAVYGPINYAGLRLITCGGDFDPRSRHYVDNIVVYATLTDAA